MTTPRACEETNLDRWIERLDYYVSTGSPMTLSAEKTIELRDLLRGLQRAQEAAQEAEGTVPYLAREAEEIEEPMPETAWEANASREQTGPELWECGSCGAMGWDRGAGVCQVCGSEGR